MALQTTSIAANGSKKHHKFTLNITENSIDGIKNSSLISWSFILSPIQTGWDWEYSNSSAPVSYTVTINGNNYKDTITSYNGTSTVTVDSGTIEVPHNSNGEKTLSFSFSVTSLSAAYLTGSASANGTLTLTTIGRKAEITSAPDFTDEENPTISYTNPLGSGVASLDACIANATGSTIYVPYRAISKTGTSYTFNLTETERENLRKAVTAKNGKLTVSFYVRTYIGETAYYSYIQKTLSLVNFLPTIAPVVRSVDDEYNSFTGSNTKIIKGYNSVEAFINASPTKGATIVSTSIINGDTFNNTSNDTFIMNTTSKINARAKAITLMDKIDTMANKTVKPNASTNVSSPKILIQFPNPINFAFFAVVNSQNERYSP